jgi:L-rhamnose isomerase
MTNRPISQDQIDSLNAEAANALADDYASLERQHCRRGIDI